MDALQRLVDGRDRRMTPDPMKRCRLARPERASRHVCMRCRRSHEWDWPPCPCGWTAAYRRTCRDCGGEVVEVVG